MAQADGDDGNGRKVQKLPVPDRARIDRILRRVREVWMVNPELRLLQLLLNPLHPNDDPFYVPDAKLERLLELYRPAYQTPPVAGSEDDRG